MKQRILWADILKWAGMLLIYLGHLPVSENTYLLFLRSMSRCSFLQQGSLQR